MTNEELIKALRYCKEHEQCDYVSSAECPYEHHWTDGEDCQNLLVADAIGLIEAKDRLLDQNTERCEELRKQLRDAHESYEKHLNELEAQLPKHGEWIEADDLEGAIKGRVFCSNCKNPFESIVMTNEKIILTNQKTKYCPNCGAKMDGKEQNDE